MLTTKIIPLGIAFYAGYALGKKNPDKDLFDHVSEGLEVLGDKVNELADKIEAEKEKVKDKLEEDKDATIIHVDEDDDPTTRANVWALKNNVDHPHTDQEIADTLDLPLVTVQKILAGENPLQPGSDPV